MFSVELMQAVVEKTRQMKDALDYIYPWRHLEKDLKETSGRLQVVGYGSLLNQESAAMTISDGARVPVIAFGVRRVFNYEMPAYHPRYGPPTDTMARAALNVVPTGRMEDKLNGKLIDVPVRDIPAFREREKGYDLLPVPCIHWNHGEETPFIAHILRCPSEPREGTKRTNVSLTPHLMYYKICREGAAAISDGFLRFWLETTFLADEQTTVAEWETVALGNDTQ